MLPTFDLRLTRFYSLIVEGNLKLVKAMVEKEQIPIDETKALSIAVEHGHVDLVKYLISKGAPLEVEENGYTPLGLAACDGNLEMCRILIEKGADINFAYCRKVNFLCYAISHDNCDMIDLALKHGFDINSDAMSPLKSSIVGLNYKSLQYLLEKGADYGKYSESHICCGMLPTRPVFHPVLYCLKVDDGGKSLQIFLNFIEKKEGKSFLIKYINQPNPKYKLTALHAACFLQNEQAIKILIEMGANVEARDWMDKTPLFFAEAQGRNHQYQRIEALLKVREKK